MYRKKGAWAYFYVCTGINEYGGILYFVHKKVLLGCNSDATMLMSVQYCIANLQIAITNYKLQNPKSEYDILQLPIRIYKFKLSSVSIAN